MPVLRHLIRFGYAPLLLIGVNGAAIHMIVEGSAAWAPGLLLLATVGLSFAAERVLPYDASWNRPQADRRRDLLHALVNEFSSFSAILALPVLTQVLPGTDAWPTAWPFILQVLFAILVLDAGVTIAHYASHRVTFLWRFHAVHHSVRRMYGFNGLMKHPVHQAIEMLAGTLPLLTIGIPTKIAFSLVFAVAIQLLLQHSNADYTIGPLRRCLATSEVHRLHHRKTPALGNVNFGLFTTLWDHLLGTFSDPVGARIESDVLGIADRPDYPTKYLDQLIEPFRPNRGSGSAGPSDAHYEPSLASIVEAPTLADGGTPNIWTKVRER